ncbi:MAG: EexN family lipoprotein [Woeseiaceae bacterium]|nr:EexN family lipoprotein [Woeseiaceae bacterium]
MTYTRLTIWIGIGILLGGCSEPPPPRSVAEFVENPIVLEAALVRCAQNRPENRYVAECVNAREANKLIAAREDETRRAAFEAQSERKRQALRRTQEAAAEARRRAAEAQRRREEAAYLAQFGELPPDEAADSTSNDTGNVPLAVIPEPVEDPVPAGNSVYNEPDITPPSDAGNAPMAETETEPPSDLGEVRDELRRRNEE